MSDRGVSTTVGLTLNLAVATLLVTGLLIGAGDLVDDRQDAATREELRVVGQRIAANIEEADRMAGAGGSEVRVATSLPDRAAGTAYVITVDGTVGARRVVLTSESTGVTVSVPFRSSTPVETVTVSGGPVEVVLTAGGSLEVRQQ